LKNRRLNDSGSFESVTAMNQKTIQRIRKDQQQDNILDELRREKAAVLARAGWAVEEVIDKLQCIDEEIEIKLSFLNSKKDNDVSRELLRQKKLICEEINCRIEEFNAFRQKAQVKYYYLIVTREALGLRRHEMVQKMYRIPDKKKKLEMKNG
jgi:dynactin complex subunit